MLDSRHCPIGSSKRLIPEVSAFYFGPATLLVVAAFCSLASKVWKKNNSLESTFMTAFDQSVRRRQSTMACNDSDLGS